MAHEEQPVFQPRYLTIPEVWELYQQKDSPLNAETILATLEPLAGTSFMQRAIEVLHQMPPGEPIYAHELYLLFYGTFPETAKSTDDQQQEDAITCLYDLAGFSVPLDAIYTMQWMEDDELLAREYRSDYLYHDPAKQQLAGTHAATQFRFYKAGVHRHTLSVSVITYEDEHHAFKVFTQLAEGNKPHRFFGDAEQPPLPFVDHRQSSFLRTNPLLFISPQFDVAKAQSQSRS